jgi:hypothetical protein
VDAVGCGPIFTPFHARRVAAAGETVEQYNARAAQGIMLKRRAGQRRSLPRSCFWPPTMLRMSPAPCCSWTADDCDVRLADPQIARSLSAH